MADLAQDNVYLVTGVVVAIDNEDGILIAGIQSDSPFMTSSSDSKKLVGHFAFTRRQAAFLKARLDEFLSNSEVKK